MTALTGEFAQQCDSPGRGPRSVGISTAGSRVTGVHDLRSQRPSIPVRRQDTCPPACRNHVAPGSAFPLGSPPLTLPAGRSGSLAREWLAAMPGALPAR